MLDSNLKRRIGLESLIDQQPKHDTRSKHSVCPLPKKLVSIFKVNQTLKKFECSLKLLKKRLCKVSAIRLTPNGTYFGSGTASRSGRSNKFAVKCRAARAAPLPLATLSVQSKCYWANAHTANRMWRCPANIRSEARAACCSSDHAYRHRLRPGQPRPALLPSAG